MPEEKKRGSSKKIKQDPLLDKIGLDPNRAHETVVLRGWLGRSTQEGRWRLYLNPQLNKYVEFSDQDIAHTEPLPSGQSPLGGSIVYFKSDVTLQHTSISSQRIQAEWLQGDISSQFLSGSLPSAGAVGRFRAGIPKASLVEGICGGTLGRCPPSDFCPSTGRAGICTNSVDICPSQNWNCPSDICPPTAEFFCR
jgi:hypothetical protein